MKSKVLSLVLAITLLCSIMVPTVSFAADSAKGEPITLDAATFNYGNSSGNVGPFTRSLPDRDEEGACILGVNEKTTAKDANGYWPSYTVTHGLDLTKPFTLEYEFYSRNVQTALASGTTTVFAIVIPANDAASGAYISNGSTLTPGMSGTNLQNAWHKAALSYDSSNYKLYVDDEVVKEWTALPGGTSATTFQLGIMSGFTFPVADSQERVYFDNVYVYQSAYEPAGSSDPDPEPDVTVGEITIIHNQPDLSRSAKVTLTEEYVGYKLFIAFYNTNNELIGVEVKEIEDAGENIVTRDQSTVLNVTDDDKEQTEYGLTTSLKAFVWTADNQPTGIIKTLP